MGWIGRMDQLLHVLAVMGCDRNSEGKFCVSGSITTFLGDTSENADVVVHGEAVYFVAGNPVNLAAALHATSYGVKVKVI